MAALAYVNHSTKRFALRHQSAAALSSEPACPPKAIVNRKSVGSKFVASASTELQSWLGFRQKESIRSV